MRVYWIPVWWVIWLAGAPVVAAQSDLPLGTDRAGLKRPLCNPPDGSTPSPDATAIGWLGPIDVAVDTTDLQGQRAQIYLRFLDESLGQRTAPVVVRWEARHGTLASGEAPLGRAVLVFDDVVRHPWIRDRVTVRSRVPPGTPARLTVRLSVELWVNGSPLPGRVFVAGEKGATTVADLYPWNFLPGSAAVPFAEARGAAAALPGSESERSVQHGPWHSIQPAGRGVRLQSEWIGHRFAFVPEVTSRNSLSIGGSFSSLVGRRAAAGFVFVLGPEKRELMINAAWRLSPTNRLLVTGAQLRQPVTMAHHAKSRGADVTQSAVGLSYAFERPSSLLERAGVNVYGTWSPSRDLGSTRVLRHTSAARELLEVPQRLAGVMLIGWQWQAALHPFGGVRMGVRGGGEHLVEDLLGGQRAATRMTAGLEWTQRLARSVSATASIDAQARHHLYSLAATRMLERQQYGLQFLVVRGRDGVPNDLQLRWTHAVTFERNAPVHEAASPPDATPAGNRELLDLVSRRPGFVPPQILARLDTSVEPTRLVAIGAGALPAGAQVDAETAAVTLPHVVTRIVLVTRNGMPFDNTGQFVVVGNRLEVRPLAMAAPQPGSTDEYVVTLENAADGVSIVTLTVSAGSVSIDRISVSTAPRRDAPSLEFPTQQGVRVSAVITSDPAVVAGINVPVPLSVVGGEYSIDGGPFTSAPGSVIDKQVIRLRHVSAASAGSETATTLTAGGTTTKFISVTKADTTPAALAFPRVESAEPHSVVTSKAVVISGIDASAPIAVAGGRYAVDNGPFTDAPGMVSLGQRVRLQLRSASSYGATRSATVTIGGIAATFVVTTMDADSEPDAFGFDPKVDVSPGALVSSNRISMTGLNSKAVVTVSGGEYSVDNASYTSTAGTIKAGQTVKVRLFAPSTFSTDAEAVLTVGGRSAAFHVRTRGPDTTPGAFSFTPQTNVPPKSFVVSNPIMVTDIEVPVPIAVSDGEYSINGGAYTANSGYVADGQEVTVRRRSSSQFSTTTTATLTIGGVAGVFSVTTSAGDTTPDPFSFSSQTDAPLSTSIVSETITITGIDAPAAISIADGEYALQGNSYHSSPGTVKNGDTVKVRVTSASTYSTTITATLTVGGVSGTFSVTTAAEDTTPDPFSFGSKSNAKTNTTVMSGAITVSGINAPSPISVSGASSSEYRINNAGWTAAAGTVNNGDTVRVRHTTAATSETSTTTTLTIGGVSGTFTSTTK